MAEPKTPVKKPDSAGEAPRSSGAEVDGFLAKVRTMMPALSGRGRLIFAMDATMSRQPSWDLALKLQTDMFRAVKKVGGLGISCQGGFTQIGKILAHARRESERTKVNAVVYVGDCMEEEIDELSERAGELGILGVPVFLFQEGREPKAERAFKEIARLTRGAYCHFDAGSARQLSQLLMAVAVYATDGRKALHDFGAETKNSAAMHLLAQLGCEQLSSKQPG
jgi:hypothetical protein